MAELSLPQLNMVRKHWRIDMSSFQLAHYFGCTVEEVDRAAYAMGLRISPRNLRMTAFHSPYEPVIAKNVEKFRWPATEG